MDPADKRTQQHEPLVFSLQKNAEETVGCGSFQFSSAPGSLASLGLLLKESQGSSPAYSDRRLLVILGECRRDIALAEDQSRSDAVSLILAEQLLDNPQ